MEQHPFLKSIRPVNLLSFGPDTLEIELRPLNILIGPNGSGKSNLIEIIALLSALPDKDPWSGVIKNGGGQEWEWKGKNATGIPTSLALTTSGATGAAHALSGTQLTPLYYSITLRPYEGGFFVSHERFLDFGENEDPTLVNPDAFERDESFDSVPDDSWLAMPSTSGRPRFPSNRSALSMVGTTPYFVTHWPRMLELANSLTAIKCYRNWTFGENSESRRLQPVGLDSNRLAPDSSNLAQVLKALRDRGGPGTFDRLVDLMRAFYGQIRDIDTELVGNRLRVMIREDGLSLRTPAERMSDGTLRWLALLVILLNPTPTPLTCIEEPELGLHPDMIPALAELLRDASTRTQLVITTHSTGLVDAFSDTPDAVCVCEKVEGATQIRRLDAEKLAIWLEDYSLGPLWASGEIGGNRW